MNNPVTNLRPESEVDAPNPLEKLRAPFAEELIGKLPKPTAAQTKEVKDDFKKGIRCTICGSWHHPNVVHLDYLGHAALTDRLLDTDLEWTWEPKAETPEGLPLFDKVGGLWIKLTVCGVTRLGYGNAEGKEGGDAVKEIIGDALRNAGMRFGIALDLWHKGDLHAAKNDEPVVSLEEKAITHLRTCAAVGKDQFADAWGANRDGWKKTMDGPAYARVVGEMKRLAATFPKEEPQADPPSPEPQSQATNDFGLGDDDLPEGLR
jgi:hypothetical protein